MPIPVASFDPFTRANLDEPYPFYSRLRALPDGLVEVPERGFFVAARHDVCRDVLRDHETFRSGLGVQWRSVAESGVRATFIENDPPEHARVRRAVQKWCTPSAIAALGEIVDRAVEPLVDEFVANGGGDVMAALARPLPLRVMSDWLGLELPDDAVTWADASFRLGAPDPPPAADGRFTEFLLWAGDGFGGAAPGGTAEKVLARGEDQRLHEDETFIALASLLIAGLDTTVHLIGNGFAALAAHPDELERLREEPTGLAPSAVEEMLRFDAPVRFFLRRTDDGRTIIVLYGAANHDAAVFEEPNQFRVERDASEHLAFGAGIHLCLGAPLARLEAVTLFRALAQRLDAIEVLPGAARTDSAAIRGYATLAARVQGH